MGQILSFPTGHFCEPAATISHGRALASGCSGGAAVTLSTLPWRQTSSGLCWSVVWSAPRLWNGSRRPEARQGSRPCPPKREPLPALRRYGRPPPVAAMRSVIPFGVRKRLRCPHRTCRAVGRSVRYLTDTTRPPVIRGRSAGSSRKTAFGVPAAAHTCS